MFPGCGWAQVPWQPSVVRACGATLSSCHLYPCTLLVLFKRFAACQQQGSIPPFRREQLCEERGRRGGPWWQRCWEEWCVWLGGSCPSPPSVASGGSRTHRAQVSQEGASCPLLPTGMPWLGARVTAQCEHTLQQRLCVVIVQRERNWESLCLSLQELDLMILLCHPQHRGTCAWEARRGDGPVACPRLCSLWWTWSQISWLWEQSLLPADPFQSGALSPFLIVPALPPLATACLWDTCH